jgi:hypothetical protein
MHSIPAQARVGLQDIELARISQEVTKRFYNLLAVGEGGRCFAMSLHVETRDPQQARVFAARAMRSISMSNLLNPYIHRSYAIRASVEAHSCKPNEARTDIQEAIELANRSGDQKAAEEYASMNPDDCWWGEER